MFPDLISLPMSGEGSSKNETRYQTSCSGPIQVMFLYCCMFDDIPSARLNLYGNEMDELDRT